MSRPSPILVELLKRIQRTRSPLTRVKLLTQAWKHVRNLDPKERSRLASAVGMKGAEALLERLGSGGDGEIRPSKLMSLIKKAEEQESTLLRKGIDVLEELVEEEAGTVPQPEPEPAEVIATTAAVREATERLSSPPRPKPETKPEPKPTPVAIPAPKPEPEPEPAKPREPVRKPEPAPRPAERRRKKKRRERPRTEWIEKLALADSLSARFRLLKRRVGEAGMLDRKELESLLQEFPDGWPRRRALQALLREGIPGEVKSAMDLIAALDSDLDRRWCTLTLLEEMADDPDAVRAMSVATSYAAVRRRARRILGKAW